MSNEINRSFGSSLVFTPGQRSPGAAAAAPNCKPSIQREDEENKGKKEREEQRERERERERPINIWNQLEREDLRGEEAKVGG